MSRIEDGLLIDAMHVLYMLSCESKENKAKDHIGIRYQTIQIYKMIGVNYSQQKNLQLFSWLFDLFVDWYEIFT